MQNIHKSILAPVNRGHMIFVLLLMTQFQLWDGVMTHVFVRSGLAREGNALVANLVYSGDFLWLKIVSVAAIGLALWTIFRRFPKLAISATAFVAVFYLSVVVWNFLVIFSNTL